MPPTRGSQKFSQINNKNNTYTMATRSANSQSRKLSDHTNMTQNRQNIFHEKSSAPTDDSRENCADCKIVLHDQDASAICDFSENTFCYICSRISDKSLYNKIARNVNEDGLMWYCPHCRISFPGVKKTVLKVAQLEKTQEEILDKLQKLENGGIDNIVQEALEEKQNIEERKLNVVCFGLAESEKGNSEERRQDDESKLVSIINEVMEVEDIALKEKPIRIGRYDSKATKSRPVKLTLTNSETRQKILKARDKLRQSDDERCLNLFIQADLTIKQRREAYLKREERRERKKAEGERDRYSAVKHMENGQRDVIEVRRGGATGGADGGRGVGIGPRRRSDGDLFQDSQQ